MNADEGELSNQELLECLADNPDRYFSRLVEKYYEPLYRSAYRIVGHKEDAEDAVQNAMLNALRALRRHSKYDKQRILTMNLSAWLYRITKNAALKILPKGNQPVSIPDAPEGSSIADPKDDPHHGPEQLLENQELLEMINKLPKKYQDSLRLRVIDKLSYQEIADKLKLSLGQVKTHIFRGRQLLRKLKGLQDES